MKLASKTRSPTKHPFRTFYAKRENESVIDADDPQLGEMIRHGTIPNRFSLRAPPTKLSHSTSTENLIGLTSQDVSKRYIVKLQQERERNNDTVYKCMDNLPIKIKKMVDDTHKELLRDTFTKSHDHGISVPRFRTGNDTGQGVMHRNKLFEEFPGEFYGDLSDHHCSKCGKKSKRKTYKRSDRKKNQELKSNSGATTATTDYSDCLPSEVASELSCDDTNINSSTDLQFTHTVGFSGYPIRTKIQRSTKSKKGTVILKNINRKVMKNNRHNKLVNIDKDFYLLHPPVVTGKKFKRLNQLPPLEIKKEAVHYNSSPELCAISTVQLSNRPLDYVSSPLLPMAPHQSMISEATDYQQRCSENLPSSSSNRSEVNLNEGQTTSLPNEINPDVPEKNIFNHYDENENKIVEGEIDNPECLPLSIDALQLHTAKVGEMSSLQQKHDQNVCNLTDIIEREESNLTRTTRTMQSDNEPEVKISVRIAYKTAEENVIKEKSNDDIRVSEKSQREECEKRDIDGEDENDIQLDLDRNSTDEEQSDDNDQFDEYGNMYRDPLRNVAETIKDTQKAMRNIDKTLMYRKLQPCVVEVGKDIGNS